MSNYYEDINQRDLLWLAGLLEGEGAFGNWGKCGPKVAVRMTDEDIIEQVSKLFGTKCYKFSPNGDRKDYYTVSVAGVHAVHLMKRLYPYLGKRRQKQIEKAISEWKGNDVNYQLTKNQVKEIYRRAHRGKETQEKIAKDYPITRGTVKDIKCGCTWKHLTQSMDI